MIQKKNGPGGVFFHFLEDPTTSQGYMPGTDSLLGKWL